MFHTRSLFVFFILIIIFFFFYNLAVYSDRLCQDQVERLEKERNSLNSQLVSLLKDSDKSILEVNSQNSELAQQNKDLLQDKEELQQEIKRLEKTIAGYLGNKDDKDDKDPEEVKKTKIEIAKPPIKKPDGTSVPDLQIPIIIFAYNRPDYLKRTLESVLGSITDRFVVYVSQDGAIDEVASVVKSFPQVHHLQKKERPPIGQKLISPSESDSYYYISAHYKFGLSKIFDEIGYEKVIILEDDMEVSPDFFGYFEAVSKILDEDETLLCASAWNDNGERQFVKDPKQLWRSNFFPGLGWMMTKALWHEIGSRWPRAYWDDWLREPPQRKGRDCIHPEISRTYTFGEHGSSQGQFFEKYLKNIYLNDHFVDWSQESLEYLTKRKWDEYFSKLVDRAKKNEVSSQEEMKKFKDSTLIMYYNDQGEFSRIANQFGLMEDTKAGIPRTAYNGVVPFRWESNLVLLAERKE